MLRHLILMVMVAVTYLFGVWSSRAETCRSIYIFNKYTKVHLLDVIILNILYSIAWWWTLEGPKHVAALLIVQQILVMLHGENKYD